jgi:hypothetical protein
VSYRDRPVENLAPALPVTRIALLRYAAREGVGRWPAVVLGVWSAGCTGWFLLHVAGLA